MRILKVELRADGLHITGYVNVTGKQSRPVITPKGKVNEVIEERAFERALERADNIPMTLDHNPNRVLAQTSDNTLSLYEDNIGLRAEAIITDEEVIEGAKAKKLKGWSFGMANTKDTIEERADKLPLRHVNSLDLDHVTLVMNKKPIYSATSIEVRADGEIDMEYRDIPFTEYVDTVTTQEISRYYENGDTETERVTAEKRTAKKYDNSPYRERLNLLKKSAE